jgi:hypothetical protein
MEQALTNKDIAKATAHMAEALKQAAIVKAAPDAAKTPTQAGKDPSETLFGTEKGDTTDVSMNDIHQHGIGDCYLLSSIGEIARVKPELIKKMIKDNGNGTYTVTLHRHKSGKTVAVGKPDSDEFSDVQVTVDGHFGTNVVNADAGEDKVGNKKEIWVQILEKAYAKLMGGYDKITDGGWAKDAMQTLTGKKAGQKPVKDLKLADLQKDLAAGKPIVMDTMEPPKGKKLPFNLVEGHAYMLDKLETDKKGKVFVRLRNPWGSNEPDPIPFEQLGKGFDMVETGSSL